MSRKPSLATKLQAAKRELIVSHAIRDQLSAELALLKKRVLKAEQEAAEWKSRYAEAIRLAITALSDMEPQTERTDKQ